MGDIELEGNVKPLNDVERQFVEKLYRDLVVQLTGYARHVLRDNELAEEVVQATFRDACVKVEMLMKHPKPEGWIIAALKLEIRRVSRDKTREYNLFFKLREKYATDVIHQSSDMDPDILYANLANDRDYILLKSFADAQCTVDEFANQLGITKDACNKRIQRARKKMKKYFKKT